MTVEWLPQSALEVGSLYRLDARRQALGVWTGAAFVGVQWEMGKPTLSHENHWDEHGSAKPLEHLGERTPAGMRLTAGWTACIVCNAEAPYDTASLDYVHAEPSDHDAVVEVWTRNEALLSWLLVREP